MGPDHGEDRGAVPYDGRPPRLRLALWVLGGLVGVAALVWLGLRLAFDADSIERRIAPALERAVGPSRISVGEVRPLPARLGFAVESVRVEVAGGPAAENTAGAPRPSLLLTVPRATVTGLLPWSLFGGSPEAGTLALESPRLAVLPDSASRKTSGPPPPTALAAGRTGAGEGEGSGGLRVERLVVEHGTLDFAVLPGAPDGVAHDVSLKLGPIDLGAVRGPAAVGEVHVEHVRLLEVEPERPAASERGFRLRDTTLVSLWGVALDGLRLDGDATIDVGRSLSGRYLSVDSAAVLIVDVVSEGPGADLHTPTGQLATLPGSGRIDSVRIRSARVQYRERRPGLPFPGQLLFDRLSFTMQPLAYGRSARSEGDSVRVVVAGRVQGAAPVWLELHLPPAGARFGFDARGGSRGLALPTLNAMFRPIDGVRIESGRLDSLAFDYRVRGRDVRGTVQARYEGLAIGFEDPGSGGSGLADHVKGFLTGLKLNEDNQPSEGEDYLTGRIEVELGPDDTFYKALWLGLRSGLLDIAGL